MIKIQRLTKLRRRALWPGNVLRTKAIWPYEDWVDFMVYRNLDEDRPFGLIVSSGHKAGAILVRLPRESALPADVGGLSRSWVVNNWKNWIYPESDVADVGFFENYESGSF